MPLGDGVGEGDAGDLGRAGEIAVAGDVEARVIDEHRVQGIDIGEALAHGRGEADDEGERRRPTLALEPGSSAAQAVALCTPPSVLLRECSGGTGRSARFCPMRGPSWGGLELDCDRNGDGRVGPCEQIGVPPSEVDELPLASEGQRR